MKRMTITKKTQKMLSRRNITKAIGATCLMLVVSSCGSLQKVTQEVNTTVPESYVESTDSTNTSDVKWQDYFTDPYLNALIDTALSNNQELNITLQEIEIARNEARARKGEYLPFLSVGAGGGVEKTARYTSKGANDATTDIKPGMEMPDPLPDYMVGLNATWEVDIWKKLRNSRKSALKRYVASIEGKNYLVTNLIAEIARSYYELLALDNQLKIVNQNIQIQTDALEIVKMQKQAARVTELAVRKFEAQVFNTKSLQYNIQQKIVETENRINFLVGRFPEHLERSSDSFADLVPDTIYAGVPSQLLDNRPDVRKAEMELEAAKLDVKVAKARFYPSLGISAGVGFQAFDPQYLIKTPQSLLFSVAGDLAAPLINRAAIKATYNSANAKQIQAIYNYEKTILNAYLEVANQLAKIHNMKKSYEFKSKEVEALNESIKISNGLFRSARADYMEVLMTQRDALESRFELIETKQQEMNAFVNMYKALGGGWK